MSDFVIKDSWLEKYEGKGEDVVIPDCVKGISHFAFSGCSEIKSVIIPKNITQIMAGVFHNCQALTSICVEDGNTVYHSKDNCLIETESNTLIAGCQNSMIPEYVTEIDHWAFRGNTAIASIVIPDGVTTIRYGSFAGCTGLKNIIIPQSVTKIERFAFADEDDFDSDCPEEYCRYIEPIIKTPAGSYAEQYAKERNIPFETID